ncbi:hypothetical protein AFM11_19085 [Mycolicibacterium wolinskyi]|uniref:Uncharacterized protein n=1 Tax=Mycolicibacterium wolinskyi TaxID=59750 RepID=A0A132PJU2_9MYCO|nr:hypothetical protein AFM11_19085 [Mycolicibacterium wolinskyi]
MAISAFTAILSPASAIDTKVNLLAVSARPLGACRSPRGSPSRPAGRSARPLPGSSSDPGPPTRGQPIAQCPPPRAARSRYHQRRLCRRRQRPQPERSPGHR